MDAVLKFLGMGGYAAYIWPAVGVVLLGMVALLVQSMRSVKRRERELAALLTPESPGNQANSAASRRQDTNEA